MSARVIPDAVLRLQHEASDPQVSAFVAANAGSGKTHVLAQRVIRLLLDGTDPARILCITFTKAAAANMANRVFGTLAKWIACDDATLDKELAAISRTRPDAELRARARRLFALALETPGGLKVQTIHAFCTRLLHLFPFEANVAARFNVLDEVTENQLLGQIMLAVLLEGANEPRSPLGCALGHAITFAADQTFKEVLREAIGKRDLITAWLDHAGGVEPAITQLTAMLGVDPSDSVEAIEAEIFSGTLVPPSEWAGIAEALKLGSKTDKEQAQRFATLVATGEPGALDDYLAIFCTADLGRRDSLMTKTLQQRHAELHARLKDEQDRVCSLIERRRRIACRDRSAALVTIAAAVIVRYRAEKDRRGLLDYDDLIERTRKLLDTVNPTWVHYKLDRGIDHLLIDEAQDTSPKQWKIVELLVSDFTAGASARGVANRTIFAVGDEKQSIFSFQQADPQMFAQMRRFFERAHRAAERGFLTREFKHSFRSGANILRAVDDVFAPPGIFPSVTTDAAGVPPHEALPDAAPGVVEIWELAKPDKRDPIEAWDAPFDTETETSPQVKLARRIANTVRALVAKGRKAGDVLVLVRQRGALFEAVIRSLKQAGIPVAGADRLILTEHIAVMDLMALADALLLPHDDLALASVLRSPLFGLSEEELYDLAHHRRGSLQAALVRKADDLVFAEAAKRLDRLRDLARRETPFAFFARVLGPEGGRRHFLARLGVEANDALDEFLNLALAYETKETPSLQGFIAWLRAAQSEVKRDMEIARDEVRVMTVHGAKGLEAPIVILADTTTRPSGPRDPRLVTLKPPAGPDRLAWIGRAADDVPPADTARAQAKAEAEHEYRRLLYVAMTRAAERLIVCGTEGKVARPKGCWYDLVRDALLPSAVEEPADDGEGTVWRYRKFPTDEAPPAVAPAVEAKAAADIPTWLARNAPASVAHAVAVSPSRTQDTAPARPAFAGSLAARQKAIRRGRLVHRLMQSLPDIAPEHRAAAARRHVARAADDWSEADREALVTEILPILADPRFAALFSAGSRAEMPIVGRVPRAGAPPLAVSGQVDRLAITPDVVLIADYKTDRPPPKQAEHVPDGYLRQLALYRAVLAMLYPDRPVRAALLFTAGPVLIELPAALLDSALAALTSP